MSCPKCLDVELEPEERHEIAIDRCPSCAGVWLDHGELEKMVAFMRQFQSSDRWDADHAGTPKATTDANGAGSTKRGLWDVLDVFS